MYIQPNSVIRLLHNCPLDTTYDHTIYFSTKAAQTNYFIGLTKYTFLEQSYQRPSKNTLKVQVLADNVYDCNYLMFQNTAFGDKWFYAYITSATYISPYATEITYQIDVMQTWHFDYSLGQCLVDREHSATDNIGENTVPESLETGDYISDTFDTTGVLNGTTIVVAAPFDSNYADDWGGMYAGVYSGLNYFRFPNTVQGALNCSNFIKNAGAKADGIVSVYLMASGMVVNVNNPPKVYDVHKPKNYSLTRSDGKPIKNKKLFTYPYNMLYVTNLEGNSAVYPYEFFSTDDCVFTVTGDMCPNPSVLLAPQNYKGVLTNWDEKLVLSGYPQLSFTTDAFRSWLAQSGMTWATNAIATAGAADALLAGSAAAPTSVISASAGGIGLDAMLSSAPLLGGAVAGSAAIPVVGLGVLAAGLLSNVMAHAVMPDHARSTAGGQAMAAAGLKDFAFMNKHIKPEFVTIIDDYFNVVGYATHRVKVPNRNVRPYWTYTKTVSCVVHGSVPADDMKRIAQIYDKGITFWTNGNNIGNYSLDNSV